MDESIRAEAEPDIPRALRLEKLEEQVRELRERINGLEYVVRNVLGIDKDVLR